MSRTAKIKNGFAPKTCQRCNLPELKERAQEVLQGLQKGKI
jgi:Zn-finger protein